MKNQLVLALCLVVVFGGLAVSSHAQTKPAAAAGASAGPKGPAWEYTVLVRGRYFDTNTALLGRWTDWETSVGDVKVTDPNRKLGDYLNQMGSEGWELVSAAPLHGPEERIMYYVFKRPKR